jgi:hypothetical protein
MITVHLVLWAFSLLVIWLAALHESHVDPLGCERMFKHYWRTSAWYLIIFDVILLVAMAPALALVLLLVKVSR